MQSVRLIAVMLGQLHMDVEECIDAYQKLAKEVFNDPESEVARAVTFAGKSVKPKFSSANLERQILRIIEERLHVDNPSDVPLYDSLSESTCKV